MFNKDKPVEIIFKDNCTKCGLCVRACPADYLFLENNQIKINEDAPFGCIQCGHCMMSCPVDAIKVRGESISENDVFYLDANSAGYDELYTLMAKRRSVRKFKNQPVPKEIIEKILEAGATGAISIPPYETKVLIVNGHDKVQELADDIVNSLKKASKLMNPFVLGLFKPLIGQTKYKLFKDFILPLIKMTTEAREKGEDILFYNAPAVIIFYTEDLGEDQDSIIAATLAMTAAETLGLGACIIGSVPPAFNNDKKLKEKYRINKTEKVTQAFILGYPETSFSKGIKRRFKSVQQY